MKLLLFFLRTLQINFICILFKTIILLFVPIYRFLLYICWIKVGEATRNDYYFIIILLGIFPEQLNLVLVNNQLEKYRPTILITTSVRSLKSQCAHEFCFFYYMASEDQLLSDSNHIYQIEN